MNPRRVKDETQLLCRRVIFLSGGGACNHFGAALSHPISSIMVEFVVNIEKRELGFGIWKGKNKWCWWVSLSFGFGGNHERDCSSSATTVSTANYWTHHVVGLLCCCPASCLACWRFSSSSCRKKESISLQSFIFLFETKASSPNFCHLVLKFWTFYSLISFL